MRWLGALVLASLLGSSVTLACPFCSSSGTTLSQDAASASLIIYGTPKNAKLNPAQFGAGTTEIDIQVVIKDHPILAGRKSITLNKFLPPPDPKKPSKLLVFCDIFKNELDPYRGLPFDAKSQIATYLKGAVALKDKTVGERLVFFFDYLNDEDDEIARDAMNEFGNSDYKDYRPVAEKFPAEKIIGWLNDPGLPLSRLGLYASMLGHCGKPEHIGIIKKILEDPARRFSGGVDGVLAGMVLLSPKEGWRYIGDLVGNPNKEFTTRYAALKAIRFLKEYRPEIVAPEELTAKLAVMIAQPDISDLAIEELRRWSYWKAVDQVLAVANDSKFQSAFTRKATLRYLLQCPHASGKDFVAKKRAENPEYVKETEELLKLESVPVSEPPKSAAGK